MSGSVPKRQDAINERTAAGNELSRLAVQVFRLDGLLTAAGDALAQPAGQTAARWRVLAAVDPAKDVDGFHPMNAGRLSTGLPALSPCTPLGCIILAKTVHASLAGMDAVVIGRSNIVGKPVTQLLLNENATVTITHSKTRDLPAVCRRADLLVAAIGRPDEGAQPDNRVNQASAAIGRDFALHGANGAEGTLGH